MNLSKIESRLKALEALHSQRALKPRLILKEDEPMPSPEMCSTYEWPILRVIHEASPRKGEIDSVIKRDEVWENGEIVDRPTPPGAIVISPV